MAVLFATLLITGCKKDEDSDPLTADMETTLDLSEKKAITDAHMDDVEDLFMQVAADHNLMGARTTVPRNPLNCGTVTITPVSGFPKTIVIDFGSGCVDSWGITRRGIINIVVNDSIRLPGSTAVMTFDNYIVHNRKIEGIITWTNTSTPGVLSWEREVENGKIIPGMGNAAAYWTYTGTRNVIQSEGVATPLDLTDDEFEISGTSTVTNPGGVSRTATIQTPLVKIRTCRYITSGTVLIDGPGHSAVIDFGSGTCDNEATITFNGRPPRTITLGP